ncbi:MAG: hypothetical protein OEX77_09230 [Candidatus Bathyarchaeota archaeon]|nr:hypothetical protein [Candidatus Bathyarchaeota archaeon]MDH5733909.1 hypothetical protein [Candidatus Bathyarchaeota archaeon]
MLRYKYPIAYELNPTEIEKGTNWVTLKLKNTGSKTLKDLDVQLHSLDTYNLSVYGTWWFGAGQHITELGPDKEKELAFRVNAIGSANVYATIKARKEGKYFWWESGWAHILISEQKAAIGHLLVLSNPYTTIGKTISAEATIKGLQKSTGLKLEFWVETPSGKSEQQAAIDIKDLPVGEEARYSAEFTPKETGFYTIYAYLYDGWRRLGYETETIYARKQ